MGGSPDPLRERRKGLFIPEASLGLRELAFAMQRIEKVKRHFRAWSFSKLERP